jgi:hypothetical protein
MVHNRAGSADPVESVVNVSLTPAHQYSGLESCLIVFRAGMYPLNYGLDRLALHFFEVCNPKIGPQ